MKRLTILITVLSLLGCATGNRLPHPDSPAKTDEASSPQTESVFLETSGTLHLVFDADGNWQKIVASGSADLSGDSPTARESALMIAIMRAKRTIAEFMNNDVKSSKTLDRIAKTYSSAFSMETADGDQQEISETSIEPDSGERNTAQEKQAQRLASKIVEHIRDSSAAIIKGAYVSHRSLENERVIVELTATRESIGAAKLVSRMMSGRLQ